MSFTILSRSSQQPLWATKIATCRIIRILESRPKREIYETYSLKWTYFTEELVAKFRKTVQ